jgi:hypothetical protein
MTIMVNGTLSVQRINGIRGEFSVGKLKCDIGVLNIKDPQLDQYETGTYQGRFGIARVYSHGYAASTGCFIVETRAILDEYIIHSDEPGKLEGEFALTEIDPLESPEATMAPATPDEPVPSASPAVDQQAKPPINKSGKSVKTEQSAAPASSAPAGDPLAELFGELWPLGETVMLDPTTVRSDPSNHRKRTQYLKSQGYNFKASSQSWVKQNNNKSEGIVL